MKILNIGLVQLLLDYLELTENELLNLEQKVDDENNDFSSSENDDYEDDGKQQNGYKKYFNGGGINQTFPFLIYYQNNDIIKSLAKWFSQATLKENGDICKVYPLNMFRLEIDRQTVISNLFIICYK